MAPSTLDRGTSSAAASAAARASARPTRASAAVARHVDDAPGAVLDADARRAAAPPAQQKPRAVVGVRERRGLEVGGARERGDGVDRERRVLRFVRVVGRGRRRGARPRAPAPAPSARPPSAPSAGAASTGAGAGVARGVAAGVAAAASSAARSRAISRSAAGKSWMAASTSVNASSSSADPPPSRNKRPGQSTTVSPTVTSAPAPPASRRTSPLLVTTAVGFAPRLTTRSAPSGLLRSVACRRETRGDVMLPLRRPCRPSSTTSEVGQRRHAAAAAPQRERRRALVLWWLSRRGERLHGCLTFGSVAALRLYVAVGSAGRTPCATPGRYADTGSALLRPVDHRSL